MKLYAHPFSSYCQKVLTALYEYNIPFELCIVSSAEAWAELERLWPMKRIPVLVDASRTLVEATIIIEYLDAQHTESRKLIPLEGDAALGVRTLDRFFDNYVMTPMQKIVGDYIRAPELRDAYGVSEARKTLDTAYRWLDDVMIMREWAAGDAFTLADCAAAPSLFYADWVHPIGMSYANLRAYRQRLLTRPSFARAVIEARPYRSLFPPGAPDRD